jgi:hypothetical protein
LGLEGATKDKFLSGILVATLSSKNMFQVMQEEVAETDGAHTSFVKYTLFSAYTTTANANMSSIAFGILFGNEARTGCCFGILLVMCIQ